MTVRSIILSISAALLVLSVTAGPAYATNTADIVLGVVQDILSATDYQREIPRPKAKPSPDQTGTPFRPGYEAEGPSDMQPNAGQIANDEPDAPSSSGDVGTYLLWVLIVAGGVLLVFYILNEIPLLVKRARAGNRQGPRSVSRSETEEMVGPASEGLLEETDRLASQGDYGDAVHVLLLRILEDLRSHLGPELRPSLTSREIVKHVTLPDDGASALGRIVNVAERSHFGGRAPSELEYRACRENFQHLVVDSG